MSWILWPSLSRERVICALIFLAVSTGGGCNSNGGVQAHIDEPFPRKLSEWRLFAPSSHTLKPNQGVVPYDLNTPLFSDYADKYRFVWMPPGTSAKYRDDGPFEFPVGTILAKTFAFPLNGPSAAERRIETRLLVRTKATWVPSLYIWNEDQSDAMLQLAPNPVPVKWTDASGKLHDFTYVIPNVNECHQCHDNDKVLNPIGPKARNLNKDYSYQEGTGSENQLSHWARVRYLQGLPTNAALPKLPSWDDPSTGPIGERARAYLDNNCAHCHQPGGQAAYTGVDFRFTQTQLNHQGLCKSPNSAGAVGDLRYDLVPGHAEESILIYRLQSTAPKISMPALGRDVVHEEGVSLLRQWIASLPGGCDSPRSERHEKQ